MGKIPIGGESSSSELKQQERNSRLSVPQGGYFSPDRLSQTSPQRQKLQRPLNDALPGISRSVPPKTSGSSRDAIIGGDNTATPKSAPVTSPSNKIFSI
jgi:hypothetical protein